MSPINQTVIQEWIEPKDIDRYWHLPSTKAEGPVAALSTPSHTLRRQRIRRAQFSAIGVINGKS